MKFAMERVAMAWIALITALPTSTSRCNQGLWRAVVVAFTLTIGLCQLAHAQTTYYYTGNPFSSQGNVNCPSWDCLTGNVTATVVYTSPSDFS